MRQEKTLSKWRSVFGLRPFRDGALNPGIVADRAQRVAKGSLDAGHSLGRGKERAVGTDFHSCFASINRWCTNAMLARSNARDRVQKSHGPYAELTLAHGRLRRNRMCSRRFHIASIATFAAKWVACVVAGFCSTSSRQRSSSRKRASLSKSQGSGSWSGVLFMAWVW